MLGAPPALARHGLVARLALAILAATWLGGCLRLGGPTPEARSRPVARKAKPLTTKAYYARMREIEHATDVLAASELRRFRRISERPALAPAARDRASFAGYANLVALEARGEAELKALGPPPRDLRALYDLRRREIDRSQAIMLPVLRLAKRGDYAGFVARVNRPDPLRQRERRTIEAEDRRVRSRLGLGKALAAARTETMQPVRRPDIPGHRVRFTGKEPGLSAGDRRFVEYCFRLKTVMENTKARMDAFEAEALAARPRSRSEASEFVWRTIDRARALDLQTLVEIRRLGPPPPAARAWARSLVAQARESADGLAAIRARFHDPEEAAKRIRSRFGDRSDPLLRAAQREGAAILRRLEAMKRRVGR